MQKLLREKLVSVCFSVVYVRENNWKGAANMLTSSEPYEPGKYIDREKFDQNCRRKGNSWKK
jgi:hypothetical protein